MIHNTFERLSEIQHEIEMARHQLRDLITQCDPGFTLYQALKEVEGILTDVLGDGSK